jgi:catechol 2,3-dioxygenase-like lactoylglutathione lyase family enzyme
MASLQYMNKMITNIISVSVYVLDLESALSFYVNSLGFEVHTNIFIEPSMRWASVCTPGHPDQQLMLIPVEEGMLFSGDQVQKMQSLIREEIFSYGVFRCQDLKATCANLKSKGVRFLMEPGEGFLGQYEAAFMDDSGNWFRLTEDWDAV